MLEGISKILTPEIYRVLYYAGHRDEIVIADANFPNSGMPSLVVDSECTDNSSLVGEILKYWPVDVGGEPSFTMISVAESQYQEPPLMHELFRKTVAESLGRRTEVDQLARSDFVAKAKDAYCLIRTCDLRPFGTISIRKGFLLMAE